MTFLSVNGISKQERGVYTLNNISFTQQAHQKTAIAGETGSGKTTLLKIIAGLLQPDAGHVLLADKKIPGPFEKLIPGHPQIAYLSQHFELRNNYFVKEELEAKNRLTDKEASVIYEVCRVNHLLDRKTDQLSGGERQRIVLARLLTISPLLLVLDEPFSNADASHKQVIKSVIDDIGKRLGVSCILVSHDAADVLPWADDIIVLKAGEMVQQGSPQQIYRQPVTEYCAGLFGEYNLVDANTAAEYLAIPFEAPEGKQLLLRPWQLSIEAASPTSSNGIIQEIAYRGDYYTAGIKLGHQLVQVHTRNGTWASGDIVHLSAAGTENWYI
jgi:ABC-type sulfate/molybdate transport systems ATPase subunit